MMINPMDQEPIRDAAPLAAAVASSFTIKRVGQRPLEFQGTELGMAMSFVPDATFWFEVNIYRTTEQRFVLVIRQFFQSENEGDTAKAWELESFGEVMDKLENYDAADDVRVYGDPSGKGMSLPELMAGAYAYRAQAIAARQQFGSLVGEILHELHER
ncbi:MAG: hypothetical protein AAGA26_02945 [Pseudomonadota bacterium]